MRCAVTPSRSSAHAPSKTREMHLHPPQLLPNTETSRPANASACSSCPSLSNSDEAQLVPGAGVRIHENNQSASFACQQPSHYYPTDSNRPKVSSYRPCHVELKHPVCYLQGQATDVLGCFPLGASGPQPVSGCIPECATAPVQLGDYPIHESILKRACAGKSYLTERGRNNRAAKPFLEDTIILGSSPPINAPQSQQARILGRHGHLPRHCGGSTDYNSIRAASYKIDHVNRHSGASVIVEPSTRAICFKSSQNPNARAHHAGQLCRRRDGSSEINSCPFDLADHFKEEDMTNRAQQQLLQVNAAMSEASDAKICPDLCFSERGRSEGSFTD